MFDSHRWQPLQSSRNPTIKTKSKWDALRSARRVVLSRVGGPGYRTEDLMVLG